MKRAFRRSIRPPVIGRRAARVCATCGLIVFSSSALASCGGGEDRVSEIQPGGPGLESTTPGARTATVTEEPATTTPTTTATTVDPSTATLQEPTATAPTTTPGTTTSEIGPADDGEAARVPATFAIDGGGVTPGRVRVPAFLTIAISASSGDGRAHTLRIATPKGPITLQVPPGGSASKDVEGLPDGEYLIAIDGQPTDGALVVGGEPGP